MEGAGQQMNEGKQGEDEQDETLDRLNEAKRELERAARKPRKSWAANRSAGSPTLFGP